MLERIFFVALGGLFGSVSRFLLADIVQRVIRVSFPFGTFIVNLVGCFLFGIVWGAFESRSLIGAEARLLLLTGFMGSFTTFSTFAFEGFLFLQATQWLHAVFYIVGQLIAGILLLWCGIMLGKLA